MSDSKGLRLVDRGAMEEGGTGRENAIYTRRFSTAEQTTRELVWKTLTTQFFQRFFTENDTLVDVGAGDGLFIKHIKVKRRIAVDLSPHALVLRDHGIEVVQVDATSFAAHVPANVDVVFMSNFLEHMQTKRIVLDVLEQCYRALRPGGKVIILQPNIRYVGPAYWDYIDHHVALTEWSLVEALEVTGFRVLKLIPRFLPYTVKSRVGRFSGLVSLYLKLPILWRLFGKQTLVVAEK